MAIYPLAPETKTLDPLSTEGIMFEYLKLWISGLWKANALYKNSDNLHGGDSSKLGLGTYRI